MTFQQNLICFSWKILKRQTSNVVSSKIYSILASPLMFFKYLFFNHIFIYIYGKTFNSVASVWQLVARLRGGCSLVENSPNFFYCDFRFIQLCNFALRSNTIRRVRNSCRLCCWMVMRDWACLFWRIWAPNSKGLRRRVEERNVNLTVIFR